MACESSPETNAKAGARKPIPDSSPGPWHAGGAGPLAGLKVLDLTLAMAGPLAASREVPFARVRQADVLIQNDRPGVAARLGIEYEALSALDPKLVYISISGYGDSGPMVDRPGQDLLLQSFSGLMYGVGAAHETPHCSPVYGVDTCASHLAVLLAAALENQIQELTVHLTSGRLPLRTERPFASVWMEPPEDFDDPQIALLGDAAPGIDDARLHGQWRDAVGAAVEFSPVATQAGKAAVRASMYGSREAGLRLENELMTLCFAHGADKEGAARFRDRKQPAPPAIEADPAP